MTLLVLGMAGSGCERAQPPQGAQSADSLPVVIGVSRSIFSAPLALAIEKGYLAEAGLRADIRYYGSGKKALQGLLTGEVEFATVADAPIMKAAFSGDDFVVLGTFIRSNDHGKMVARRDSGIETKADLAGKRIGLALGTTAEFYLHRLLGEMGIDVADVQLYDIPAARLRQAIVRGEVDAVVGWEPLISQAKMELGEQGRYFINDNPLFHTFNLVALRGPAEGRELKSERILRALQRASRFAAEQPAEAKQILAAWLDLPPADLERIWGRYDMGLSLNQGFLLVLEAEARWHMERNNLAGPMPNYLQVIDASVLRRVQPDAVDPTY